MKYQCIRCKKIWGMGDEEEYFSHGLCKSCARILLMHTVRKKQLREGNFDCFGRATNFCDQYECKYRSVCLKTEDE